MQHNKQQVDYEQDKIAHWNRNRYKWDFCGITASVRVYDQRKTFRTENARSQCKLTIVLRIPLTFLSL